MMNRLFGREERTMTGIVGLSERIDHQNRAIIETNTSVAEIGGALEGIRDYLEAMEVRQAKRLEQMYDKTVDEVVRMIKAEVAKLESSTKPREVVKAIENRTKADRKTRALKTVKARLNKAVAEYLMHDLPLTRENTKYKTIELTPQGSAVYDAVSSYIVSFAKVVGRNKEYYTARSKYDVFFRKYGITPYRRVTVRKSCGKQQTTLLSAVIVNGHIRQYIDYISKLLDEEIRKIENGEMRK